MKTELTIGRRVLCAFCAIIAAAVATGAGAMDAGATGAGATNALESAESKMNFSAGADLRFRYDWANDMPTDNHGESPYTDYLRLRVRAFAQLETGPAKLYLRIADEFRNFRRPVERGSKQRFPDVVFIDNLYLQWSGLDDAFDVKFGRQDLAYGERRIIADGTGGEGARSAYFDGARVVWHADRSRTLDAFALYCACDDYLPTLGKEHEPGKEPHAYDLNGYGQDEIGLGLYWQDRANADFGYDLYLVSKEEIRLSDSKYRSEGQYEWTHTAGFRALPRFGESFKGEAEAAIQFGDHDRVAGQAYGALTYAPKCDFDPFLTAAVWYLSGDRDGARGRRAWRAVFNRETGLGETLAPMFTSFNYTNLIYPHLRLGAGLCGHALDIESGPMFTAVRERDARGDDYGSYRGLFCKARCIFALGEIFGEWAAGGKVALQGEWLQKGDYFERDSRSAALYFRIEVSWAF